MTSAPPNALAGSWWAYPNRAGNASSSLELPDGERPIAAAFGRVASVTFGIDRGPGTPLPATLRVRDIASGREVARADCPEGCDLGVALARDALYYLAYVDAPAAGLFALSLADGSVSTLVESDGSRRGALVMSPSCRTLALLVVEDDWLAGVVDVASRSVSLFAVESVPFAVSDSHLFTRGAVLLCAYELAAGTLAWTVGSTPVVRGYVTADGSRLVVQAGFDPVETSPHGLPIAELEARPAIKLIDAATGVPRAVQTWELPGAPSLWIGGSSDDVVALINPSRDGVPVARPIAATFLDLGSGATTAPIVAGP